VNFLFVLYFNLASLEVLYPVGCTVTLRGYWEATQETVSNTRAINIFIQKPPLQEHKIKFV
jgi:hypothetical protein